MSSISTAFRLLKDPVRMIPPLSDRGLLNWLPDSMYISLKYQGMTGKKLNLKEPKGFNEKLQYLKLNNRNPAYIEYVDKYRVRRYVSDVLGDSYLVPFYGKWDQAEDISFEKMPDTFVLKCNHDSGSIKVIKNKSQISLSEIKKYYTKRIKRSPYYYGREWPYKYVKPCIIAEAYLEDNTGELRDYKFFCFDGEVRFFKVDFDRFNNHRANYYDTQRRLLPISEMLVPNDIHADIVLPNEIEKMIELAEKLSKNIPFVRVDFYDVNGAIYFGEMTFFPGSGFDPFLPEEWEMKIGDMLTLPSKK